eukprot:gene29724-38864_t
MLLNDFSIFQKISANYNISRAKRSDEITGFGSQSSSSSASRELPFNSNELDIDRLLSSSPIITESSTTYYDEITDPYLLSNSKPLNGIEPLTTDSQKLRSKKISKEFDSKDDLGEESLVGICITNDDQKSLFRAVSTNSLVRNSKRLDMNPMGSTLTQLLKQENDKLSHGDTLKLTVYLPTLESMEIAVSDTICIQEVIVHILSSHKQSGLRPPLKYDRPNTYELRIHDGDGLPDTDFPALDLNKKMKKYGIDEVCICEIEDFTSNSNSFLGSAARSSMMSFDPRNFGSYPSLRQQSPDNISESSSSFEEFPESRISKSQPTEPVTECVITYEPGACMIDLLPLIEKEHKLKLYITEYVFAMSDQDKHRLKLMTPLVDMKASVSSIGTSTFLLQKKEYADNVKQTKQTGTANKLVVNNQRRNLPDAVYGYQQVFGVDGVNVYNAKRGQEKDNTKVHRAQRKISTIQSIEIMAIDSNAFCIKWIEDRETISIEYICENRMDCKEIVQKIKQIIANPTQNVEFMQNKYC